MVRSCLNIASTETYIEVCLKFEELITIRVIGERCFYLQESGSHKHISLPSANPHLVQLSFVLGQVLLELDSVSTT